MGPRGWSIDVLRLQKHYANALFPQSPKKSGGTAL